MIFVTVGSTHFDKLIREVDRLALEGRFDTPPVCQIGKGTYQAKHVECFRFDRTLDHWFAKADIVVTHGGVTVLTLLQMRKKFVAIANTDLADDHQTLFLERLSRDVGLLWSRNVGDLEMLLRNSVSAPVPEVAFPHLAPEILGLLRNS